MPEAKDLYFFDRYYDRGLSWYAAAVRRRPGREHDVVGEVCQDYLFHPEAAARIAESLGDARPVMVTLRDPADRAFSSYLYMLKQGEQPAPFLEALRVARPELLDHGRYASGLQPLPRPVRPRAACYVAVFDDLGGRPAAVHRRAARLPAASQPLTLTDELLAARLPAGKARSVLVSRAGAQAQRPGPRARRRRELVGRVKRSPLVQRVLYRRCRTTSP